MDRHPITGRKHKPRNDADKIVEAIEKQSENIGKWLGDINTTLQAELRSVASAIANIQTLPPPQPNKMEGFLMSFIVPADQPDVAYTLTLGEVTDSEGNVVPTPELTIEVTSDDSSVVEILSGAEPLSGNVHFGSPGNATVTANVSDSEGNLLGTGVAGFVVTAGDPAAITGVSLAFEGLADTPA